MLIIDMIRGKEAARLLGLMVVYSVLARLVLIFSTENGNVTIFWIPGGIAVAALVAWGIRLWPAVLVGALAAGLLVNDPPALSLAIAIGNTLETVAAVWLLKRLHFNTAMENPRDYLNLSLTAAMASVISAIIGPAALFMAGFLNASHVVASSFHWWQGDFLGIALGTPLFLVWRTIPDYWLKLPQLLEFLALFSLVFLLGQIEFFEWFHPAALPYRKLFWFFLLNTLVAVRFGRHGVLLLSAMVALQALWGAGSNLGYFKQDLIETGLQMFWFFQLTLTAAGMTLALVLRSRNQINIDLQQKQQFLNAVIENSGSVIFAKNRQGVYQLVNRQWEMVTGFCRDVAIGKNDMELFPLSVAQQFQSNDRAIMETGQVEQLEEILESANGRRDFLSVKFPLIDPTGQVSGVCGMATEITERKQIEESLRLAMLVYENSSEAMIVTELDGAIVSVNPAFCDSTGYTAEEVIGKNPKILSSGRHDKAFYDQFWESLNRTGSWKGEIWNRRKNGELYYERLSINTVSRADGTPWRRVALFSDITEQKASEEIVWRHAYLDPLTGLSNRRMFYDRLGQAIKKSDRSGLPLALLFLDLDRFKEVNDTLGHIHGDTLLKEAAQRLLHCVRDTDSVSRLGGDEFTVILHDLDSINSADRVAQTVLNSVSQPYQLADQTAYISVSIGITLYPNDASDIEQLVKNADQAMYAAKYQGRSCHRYFTRSMQEAADQRLNLTNDLRAALVEKQFEVYYQPIVDLKTRQIDKAEALIRWNHPIQGQISPTDFIPIAEDTGLIHEIGDWVFHQAVEQTQYWRQTHHPEFQISVNKSPVQFKESKDCHNGWTKFLTEIGLPGNCLVIEITEGLLLDAANATYQKLIDYRDCGINIAIDDFGTGYSALSYLKKFDIDFLKIDQSFTRNLSPESSDFALCEAIVVMAHKLGLKVIAEGVETEQQLKLLEQIDCDYGQGFLFAKALPASEFNNILLNNLTSDKRGNC